MLMQTTVKTRQLANLYALKDTLAWVKTLPQWKGSLLSRDQLAPGDYLCLGRFGTTVPVEGGGVARLRCLLGWHAQRTGDAELEQSFLDGGYLVAAVAERFGVCAGDMALFGAVLTLAQRERIIDRLISEREAA